MKQWERIEARCAPAVVGALVIGGAGWAWLALPKQAAVILGVAGVLAYAAWFATTYRHPISSRRTIAIYLLAVAFQLIHMAEEYTGGFPHEFLIAE